MKLTRTAKDQDRNPKKKFKLTEHVNRAIVNGKKNWRPHLTTLQALDEVPKILEQDIIELEGIISSFYQDGGAINKADREDGLIVLNLTFETISWTVAFGQDGKRKYKAFEDRAEGESDPETIDRIGEVIAAHMELPKRKYALKHIEEIIDILKDDNAKNAIEHMLDTFDGNDLLTFNAATASNGIFEVDVDKVLEELK